MLKYWPIFTFMAMLAFAGVGWAVDARIDQKTDSKIQQLRTDLKADRKSERVKYLEMKNNAGIITDDEQIELKYLTD